MNVNKEMTGLKVWNAINSILIAVAMFFVAVNSQSIYHHGKALRAVAELFNLMKDVTAIHVYPTEGGGRGDPNHLQWSNEPEVRSE